MELEPLGDAPRLCGLTVTTVDTTFTTTFRFRFGFAAERAVTNVCPSATAVISPVCETVAMLESPTVQV